MTSHRAERGGGEVSSSSFYSLPSSSTLVAAEAEAQEVLESQGASRGAAWFAVLLQLLGVLYMAALLLPSSLSLGGGSGESSQEGGWHWCWSVNAAAIVATLRCHVLLLEMPPEGLVAAAGAGMVLWSLSWWWVWGSDPGWVTGNTPQSSGGSNYDSSRSSRSSTPDAVVAAEQRLWAPHTIRHCERCPVTENLLLFQQRDDSTEITYSNADIECRRCPPQSSSSVAAPMPIRSRHCAKCGHCVRKFDHHCFWVGTCIGERNHLRFLVMLLIGTFYLGAASYLLIIYGITTHRDTTCSSSSLALTSSYPPAGAGHQVAVQSPSPPPLQPPPPPPSPLPFLSAQWWWFMVVANMVPVVLALPCFFMFVFVLVLALFHVYLVATNQTTWEVSSGGRRISYLTQYRHRPETGVAAAPAGVHGDLLLEAPFDSSSALVMQAASTAAAANTTTTAATDTSSTCEWLRSESVAAVDAAGAFMGGVLVNVLVLVWGSATATTATTLRTNTGADTSAAGCSRSQRGEMFRGDMNNEKGATAVTHSLAPTPLMDIAANGGISALPSHPPSSPSQQREGGNNAAVQRMTTTTTTTLPHHHHEQQQRRRRQRTGGFAARRDTGHYDDLGQENTSVHDKEQQSLLTGTGASRMPRLRSLCSARRCLQAFTTLVIGCGDASMVDLRSKSGNRSRRSLFSCFSSSSTSMSSATSATPALDILLQQRRRGASTGRRGGGDHSSPLTPFAPRQWWQRAVVPVIAALPSVRIEAVLLWPAFVVMVECLYGGSRLLRCCGQEKRGDGRGGRHILPCVGVPRLLVRHIHHELWPSSSASLSSTSSFSPLTRLLEFYRVAVAVVVLACALLLGGLPCVLLFSVCVLPVACLYWLTCGCAQLLSRCNDGVTTSSSSWERVLLHVRNEIVLPLLLLQMVPLSAEMDASSAANKKDGVCRVEMKQQQQQQQQQTMVPQATAHEQQREGATDGFGEKCSDDATVNPRAEVREDFFFFQPPAGFRGWLLEPAAGHIVWRLPIPSTPPS